MNRTMTILAGALAAQLGLAAITWQDNRPEPVEAHPLVQLDKAAVTELVLWDAPRPDEEPKSITLGKADGNWVIVNRGNYPADATKVDEVLDILADLSVRVPLATSAQSHNKLKVSDSDYTRKVSITAGDTKTVLFLGAGTAGGGLVRLAESAEVFRVAGLSPWSVRPTARSYHLPNYIDAEVASLTSLEIRRGESALILDRGADGVWSSPQLTEGQVLDPTKVVALVSKAAKVRIGDLPEDIPPASVAGLASGTHVTWTEDNGGATLTGGYSIGAEQDGKVWVQQQGNPHMVLAQKSALSPVLDAAIDGLLSAPIEPVPAP